MPPHSRGATRTFWPTTRPSWAQENRSTRSTSPSSTTSGSAQLPAWARGKHMIQTIHVAHSPDSDDAFMFYALAEGKLDTGTLRYVHELADIESLNQRALRGELEVSAVSIHAYAYLADRYALLASGSSMGDGYGPRIVALDRAPPDARSALQGKRVAVPGLRTTAWL